jgi:hypothetical protein
MTSRCLITILDLKKCGMSTQDTDVVSPTTLGTMICQIRLFQIANVPSVRRTLVAILSMVDTSYVQW